MPDQEPKIQIDDDWKSEAAAEKARLAESQEADEHHSHTPAAGISALIQLLAVQAMAGLGGMRSPDGQELPPNLDVAKHYIDLIGALDEKTAGNLSPEEKQVLDTTLHQLRMAYVEVMSHGQSGGA